MMEQLGCVQDRRAPHLAKDISICVVQMLRKKGISATETVKTVMDGCLSWFGAALPR